MAMVVYYHCICPYYIWGGIDNAGVSVPLYTKLSVALNMVHLPIFFLVAGYLFGYKRIRGGGAYAVQRQFLVDKAQRVLVPYVTVGLLVIAIGQARPGEFISGCCSHLWFLVTIFECYAVGKLIDFILWEKPHTKVTALLAVGIGCVFGYFCPVVLGGRFLHYFFFYLGGMLLSSINMERLQQWRPLFVVATAASLAVIVLETIYCNYLLPAVLSSVALVFCAFLALLTSHINDLPNWMKSLDACSMGIYIVHHIIIQAVNRTDLLHPLLQKHYFVYPTVQFVLVLLLSWGFVWALRRYRWARYFGL